MQLTKRSSLFILAGIAATSGILFATNQAFRRWSHSTGTTSMSNSIHVESLQAEAKTANPNTAQTTLFGSDKIGISSTTSLQDDGQSTIFYPQSTKTGDRQNFIIPWLTAPAQDKDLEQFLVKKATFYVQGDAFILKNGASLAPHFDAYNARIAASGSDLIIYANPTKTGPTYLIVKTSNDHNYIIESEENRYGGGLFMIGKDSNTIFQINRGNDVGYGGITYIDKDKSEYGLYGQEPIATPTQTKLLFTLNNSDSGITKPLVYHVTLGGKSDAKKTALIKEVSEKKNSGIAQALGIAENIENYTLLSPNSSGQYAFTTTNAQKQAILTVSNAFAKPTMMQTDIPFTATLSDIANDYEPYIKTIESPYTLKPGVIETSLQTILGTGAYVMQGDTQFMYKIQPKKNYGGDIIVTNVFGESIKVPMKLYIETIDPRVVVQQVLANSTLSILPSDSSFEDVLIQHKNIGEFPITFQACTLNGSYTPGGDAGSSLENHFFSCDGKVYTQKVTTKDFVYRKAYRTAVKLPADFPKTQAFKVSIPQAHIQTDSYGNSLSSSHYFLASDIGIWSKVAGKTLHTWAFLFKDNTPITKGTITMISLAGKTIASKEITSTNTTMPLPQDKDGNIINEPVMIKVSDGSRESFVLVHPNGASDRWPKDGKSGSPINSFLNPSDVVSETNQLNTRGGDNATMKIYGYSDRGLYKAGETIYFAGFARDLTRFDTLAYLDGARISVSISDTQGNQIYNNDNLPLDSFGGFKASATIPQSLQLGDGMISYTLIPKTGNPVSYSHNIKIEEYQKPTYFSDVSYIDKDELVSLVVAPQYYFGLPVGQYDAKITWSLAGKDSCAYCRWWNRDDYYYNYVFNDTISTGGTIVQYGHTGTLTSPLFAKKILAQKGYNYTLKADIIIRDTKSDEVSFVTKYIDFAPQVKIGLNGQPYEWLYDDGTRNTKTTFKIDGEIAEGKKIIDTAKYEVYYRSYDQELQQGLDGSPYYINGTEYKKITEGKITPSTNFSIPTTFITKPGSYLVRVIATDDKGTVVGEVHKQVEYYSFANDSDGLLGALPNNYTLTVSIPKKTYEENEEIPVDIAPYQKGARVIMTIERGDRIVDTIEQTLDGKPLSIKVKKGYAPNITVNVMQIAGTELANTARKEPRFYVGFGQAQISTAMHTLNVALSTDKDTYAPGEKVTLTIKTTDSKGNPTDARVSLGVIDQALMSLYDLVKEPIPYFFNKLGTNVYTYTNMKLLYQSLRAFANNGSKGGGGDGGSAMFSTIRDDLEDTAFRRGGIITTGGKAELTFNLPANVTTWVIDAIGISKDTRLGTSRKNIIAKKDLILEANAPAFVTLGDKIQVPVKVIASPSAFKEGRKVVGTASMTNDLGDTIKLGSFSIDANQKLLLPIEVPASRSQAHSLTLTLYAEYGNAKDGIAQTIPLRREGLVIKDSTSVIAKDGKHTFTIPASLSSTITVALSTFPTHIVDPVLEYTLSTYNGTQQLMSSSLAVAAADVLISKGNFVSSIMTGDNVMTDDGLKNTANFINNAIAQVLTRQQSDGSIGRRDATETKNTLEKYLLTTYTYGALRTLQNRYSAPGQLDSALARIESYLWNYRTTSDSTFMRYLAQKTQAGKALNKDEVHTLDGLKPLNITYGGLLRYMIAVYQKDAVQSAEWKKFAILPTNQERTSLGMYLNQPRGLLAKADALLADQAATQTERMDALSQLISSRNAQGTRGMDAVNAQALWTITRISPDTWTHKDPVSCTVTIDGKSHDVKVKKPGITISHVTKNSKDVIAEFTCDNTLIADTAITYVPEKLTDLLGADKHVTQMSYSISDPTVAIGDTTKLAASWTTTLAAQNAVISIYIPSTYKFLNTIKTKNQIQQPNGMMDYMGPPLPFDLSDSHCIPTHRETRYDQLYLYYDTLPAVTCDITIPLLKAYNGNAVIMPMTVSEMYKGNVNGRKVVIQK